MTKNVTVNAVLAASEATSTSSYEISVDIDEESAVKFEKKQPWAIGLIAYADQSVEDISNMQVYKDPSKKRTFKPSSMVMLSQEN